jgi:hypothetical protein
MRPSAFGLVLGTVFGASATALGYGDLGMAISLAMIALSLWLLA